MKKKYLITLLLSLVQLVSFGVLLFQAGISLDENHSFETFFYDTRVYLFIVGGISLILLIFSAYYLLPKSSKIN